MRIRSIIFCAKMKTKTKINHFIHTSSIDCCWKRMVQTSLKNTSLLQSPGTKIGQALSQLCNNCLKTKKKIKKTPYPCLTLCNSLQTCKETNPYLNSVLKIRRRKARTQIVRSKKWIYWFSMKYSSSQE